jgi:hypothetical protein
MQSDSHISPLRVIIKAFGLFVLANLLLAAIHPPLGRLSIYNSLVPGRQRFPFEDAEFEHLGHTMMLYEDFDAMFASHVISEGPKPSDEFRVILLGDSSVWGYNLPGPGTLSSQLNALNLLTCAQKKVVVYNLAYVGTYLPKDLLILDRAMQYKPDLILWFVTLDTFTAGGRSNAIQMLSPHAGKALEIIASYNLNIDTYGMKSETFSNRTFWTEKSRLKKIARLQLDGLLWSATDVDFYVRPLPKVGPDALATDPVHKTPDNYDLTSGRLSLDVLGAGYEIASPVPVLVINEPIYISAGMNSKVRYNSYYPRRAYDHYRSYLSEWMRENGHPYMDLWDFLPAGEFRNTPLHYSAAGEKMVAAHLAPELLQMACQ